MRFQFKISFKIGHFAPEIWAFEGLLGYHPAPPPRKGVCSLTETNRSSCHFVGVWYPQGWWQDDRLWWLLPGRDEMRKAIPHLLFEPPNYWNASRRWGSNCYDIILLVCANISVQKSARASLPPAPFLLTWTDWNVTKTWCWNVWEWCWME